jgi:hypothetical protein
MVKLNEKINNDNNLNCDGVYRLYSTTCAHQD